jgi:hypothetical protein
MNDSIGQMTDCLLKRRRRDEEAKDKRDLVQMRAKWQEQNPQNPISSLESTISSEELRIGREVGGGGGRRTSSLGSSAAVFGSIAGWRTKAEPLG